MTIVKSEDGKNTTLKVEGRVDAATSPQLQDAILGALQSAESVVVDFAGVPYLSSAGLRALLLGHKQAAAKGVTMTLADPSDFVLSVLKSVGFDKILRITQGA